MSRSGLLLFAVGALALLLSGCMAVGMGMHGMMGHDASHQDQSLNIPLIEEMHAGQVRIVLKTSPLTPGEEAILSVEISDLRSGAPLSGAQVIFAVQQVDHSPANAPAHLADDLSGRRAEEVAEKGIYQLRHVFTEPGVYKITAQVRLSGSDTAASPLIISATREVSHREHTTPSLGLSPMGVFSGLGMVLMMAAMMGGLLFF